MNWTGGYFIWYVVPALIWVCVIVLVIYYALTEQEDEKKKR